MKNLRINGSSFDDYLKSQPWTRKLGFFFFNLNMDARDFIIRLGLIPCPHDGTVGMVGGKKHFCLSCKKEIPNSYWKEDRKVLKHASKKKN